MNHHSGDRHVRMLLFGLLNGLGQCLQYSHTQWQHHTGRVGGAGRRGWVELNAKKKGKKKQEENENAGFTMMLFYFSGLAGGRRDWMK